MGDERIVDVFPYFNEEAPLLARYLELQDTVDYFVGVEANLTHSGQPNSPRLADALDKLEIPRERFIILSCDLPPGSTGFERDRLRKSFATSWLREKLGPQDWVLFGDVDEVPRATAVRKAISLLSASPHIMHGVFAQEMNFGFLNYREKSHRLLSYMGDFDHVRRKSRLWLGTVIQRASALDTLSLDKLRHPEVKSVAIRISEGGWHFSACSGPLEDSVQKRVRDKYSASAHREFHWIAEASDADITRVFTRGKDPLGRRFVRFEKVNPAFYLSESILSDARLKAFIWE